MNWPRARIIHDRHHLIRECLRLEDPSVARDVYDAIGRIFENPNHPRDVMVRRLRGRAAQHFGGEAAMALLPHGWRLTYEVRDGRPPTQMHADVLVVYGFVKLIT